jgi:hypothetical protein
MKDERSHSARERLLDLLAAASLANLCLLLVWRELLFADGEDRYWMIDFSSRHYAAALFNLAMMTAVLYWAARSMRRSRSRLARGALLIILLAALAAPANYARLALGFDERALFGFVENWWLAGFVATLTVFLLWLAIRHARVTLAGLRILLIVLLPFAISNVVQASWAAATLEQPRRALRSSVPEAPKAQRPRVVWLIFDELDWRLGFEERPVRVRMPEFTQLAGTSVVAMATEASSATMIAIPSLTTGRKVTSARRLDERELALTFKDGPHEVPWRSAGTVFADAAKLGSRTEIVGFYHPYCRIFLDTYQRCSAFPMDVAHMAEEEPVGSIVLAQLARLLPINRRIAAIWMYELIAERTVVAVGNSHNDFVFAHLPVPHGPNIWSAKHERFTVMNLSKDGYFDNLELADRLLGEVRRSLVDAKLWDSTVLVVTADHGWRHGDLVGEKRDRRVPLLVRFPGQQVRYDVSGTVDAAATVKRLVLSVLAGEVRSPEELKSKLSGEWRALAAAEPVR